MEYQQLAQYHQNSRDPNKVKVILTNGSGQKHYFNLRVELINQIVIEEGNRFEIFLNMPDSSENIIECDFSGLKPAYNQPVIKKSLKKPTDDDEDDYVENIEYAITKKDPKRGHMLYLTKRGWIKEKKYNPAAIKVYSGEPTEQSKFCMNPACQKQIKPGAKFCPFCGATQNGQTAASAQNQAQEQNNTCIKCKKEIKPGAKFCPFCGSKQ